MRACGGHATPVTIALRAGLAAAVRASPAAGLLGGAEREDIRTLGADIPPGALLRRCPSPPPPVESTTAAGQQHG